MKKDEIDIKEVEKSAYDTYNVRALIGCLVRAIHDKTHDNIETEEEIFFWQLKGSLEMAYDILDDAAATMFEVVGIVDRKNRQSRIDKGQDETERTIL